MMETNDSLLPDRDTMPVWPFDLIVDGIYYKHVRSTNQVIVTSSDNNRFEYREDFIIPRKVTYREREYQVTGIGKDAFSYSAIFFIEIPDCVTNIGDGAFRACTGLTSITISKNVSNIGKFAFFDCNLLKEIRVEAPVPPICGEKVFEFIPKTCKLIVPENSKKAYRGAAEWKNFLF
ncbi:hypothetical protein FACS1894177_00990 [Bacteroidia bacterium]|nr:hypothetical protein FACS1894177_00990 [Bacteroidia bacterium]